ncbi:phosphatidylglycerol lysyltransferase domain-containing protein [Methanobrevibacter sp. OttesenSCG-928-K11]|nr:phosphatidylglycerol lysyltransferase domain-containing protein [Methanobrevibacter sp. OttesenSCG-928-K11]
MIDIEFKPISLSDKPIFDDYFNKTNFNNAEKNFSNLFMWRHTYEYEYAIINDCLCIKGKLRDTKQPFCHFPYGNCNIEDSLSLIKEIFKKEGNELIIKPLLPEMKKCLEKTLEDVTLIEDRDSFDYIYTSNKLITLSGSKLRNKRRWVKKFKEKYDYKYERINSDNLAEAKEFTLNIIKNSNNDSDEIRAMEEMFDNLFELNIKGCIIRIADKIVGVSTGEELTKDTVVIHCERGDNNFEGVYNCINQEFCEKEWSDYEFINREEDLGIEGLRQAKLTYRPDLLLSKYIAKIEV